MAEAFEYDEYHPWTGQDLSDEPGLLTKVYLFIIKSIQSSYLHLTWLLHGLWTSILVTAVIFTICFAIYLVNRWYWQIPWIEKYGQLVMRVTFSLAAAFIEQLLRIGQSLLVYASNSSLRRAIPSSDVFKKWLLRIMSILAVCVITFGMLKKPICNYCASSDSYEPPTEVTWMPIFNRPDRVITETIKTVQISAVLATITTTQRDTITDTQTAFVTATETIRQPFYRARNTTTHATDEGGLQRRNISELLKEERYAAMPLEELNKITGPMMLKTVGYQKRHLSAETGYCHICRQEHGTEIMMAQKEFRYENEWVYE